MSEWRVMVDCKSEKQASSLAKLIEANTGLEINVKGVPSMSCKHPPDRVKRYTDDDLRFCTQCNQRVVDIISYETRKNGRLAKPTNGCLHPPRNVSTKQIENCSTNDCYGKYCNICGCEVVRLRYYLLPDLSDAPGKLPEKIEFDADEDAPGLDYLVIMPERLDDTAGRREPVEIQP